METSYPLLEQLQDVGLLVIIGRYSDELQDHTLLLDISKLTNEVHELLFSNTSDVDPNHHTQLSMEFYPGVT